MFKDWNLGLRKIIRSLVTRLDSEDRSAQSTTRQEELVARLKLAIENLVTGVSSTPTVETIPISAILKSVVEELGPYAQSRGIEFRLELGRLDLQVVANSDAIRRVIQHILYNAAKYSWTMNERQLAWISVDVVEDDADVLVHVESWGQPITPEEIQNGLVFKPGYRGRFAMNSGTPGVGYGLADARRLSRRWGGDVTINSRPARGQSQDPNSGPFVTTATIITPKVAI